MVEKTHQDRLVGPISRGSTEIEARERPAAKDPPEQQEVKRTRGRPKRGEHRAKTPTRLEHQGNMTLPQMQEDLPKRCDVGTKKNSKGYKETWVGCKLHLDVNPSFSEIEMAARCLG